MSRLNRGQFIAAVTCGYAVLGAAWIVFSDRILGWIADGDTITKMGTAKGLLFVGVTAALLNISLRRISVSEPRHLPDPKGRSWALLLAFPVLAGIIASIAVFAYRTESVALRRVELERLEAIARLKLEGITKWLDERRANAWVISHSPALANTIKQWLRTGDEPLRNRLLAVMRSASWSYGFSKVDLLDPSGRILLSEDYSASGIDEMPGEAAASVQTKTVVFADLHRHGSKNYIHMDYMAAVFDPDNENGEALGVLLFEMQPDSYLYPYIQSWPLPSSTGETVLTRQEGNNVVFLNELRHRKDTALSLSYPSEGRSQSLGHLILRGERLLEGKDYRGVDVLAAALPVPNTPWTLIAKVDEQEAFRDIHSLAYVIGMLTIAALVMSAGFVAFLWQRHRMQETIREIAQNRAVEDAESRYRATFDHAGLGIAHAAIEGHWLQVNRRFCDILGYSDAELLSTTFQHITHPDDLPADLVARQALIAGEVKSVALEKRYLRKDGTTVWVALTISLLRDATGEPKFFILTVDDVSHRKATEEALRASEERFQLAMHGTDDGLWDANLQTEEVYYSPRWKSMLGYGENELAHDISTWQRLIHPDDRRRALGLTRDLWNGRAEKFEIEFRMRHKDGHYLDILARGFLVRGADRTPLRLVGTHVDISDRKKVEAQLRQAAAVFSSSHEGILVTDRDTNIVAVNPSFTGITGYAETELVGKNPRVLKSGRHDADFYRTLWASITTQGYWQGEIWNRRKSGEVYPELLTISAVHNSAGEVTNYIGTFTDISRLKQSEERLELLAHHDALTGLSNRLVFLTRLSHAIEQCRREGTRGAVLYIDLDRFKNVNDSIGHPAGDELLVLVAGRLRARVGAADTLSRFGGDEFVVLLEGLATTEHAAAVAQSLIDGLVEPFVLSPGQEVYIGASIGISVFPDDGDIANDLIQHADAAMYEVKGRGRAGYHFYTPFLTVAANARLELEVQLRHALKRGEFALHYQPLMSLTDRRITGVEALVRWHHPTRGMVRPDEFIPVAEETGLIIPLGDWVLRNACAQMRAWIAAGINLETIAVNLSPRQLRERDIEKRIREVLDESGLQGSRLELEITESALMEQGTGAMEMTLCSLKALGVRIALDDFGTGYSSLAYLKRFPIDRLKIDKQFIRDIPADHADVEIALAIISLGKTLKLEVLAEGVETEAQLEFLVRHGCDAAQGYLFSRPLPADDIASLLGLFSGVPSRVEQRLSA